MSLFQPKRPLPGPPTWWTRGISFYCDMLRVDDNGVCFEGLHLSGASDGEALLNVFEGVFRGARDTMRTAARCQSNDDTVDLT